jgi:hypothetical protein
VLIAGAEAGFGRQCSGDRHLGRQREGGAGRAPLLSKAVPAIRVGSGYLKFWRKRTLRRDLTSRLAIPIVSGIEFIETLARLPDELLEGGDCLWIGRQGQQHAVAL